jgi:hypothetical protein
MLADLLGGVWVNQDEFSHKGKGAKRAFLAEIARTAADKSVPVLLVDKINTMRQHRSEILDAMESGVAGDISLIQIRHPIDKPDRFDEAIELCLSRIQGRGESHRTLKATDPNLDIAKILRRTANGVESMGEDELSRYAAHKTVDMTLSPLAMVQTILQDLEEAGFLSNFPVKELVEERRIQQAYQVSLDAEAKLASAAKAKSKAKKPPPLWIWQLEFDASANDTLRQLWESSHAGRAPGLKLQPDFHVTLLYIGGGSDAKLASRYATLSDADQARKLRDELEKHEGMELDVQIEDIVWDDRLAAASVSLPSSGLCANTYSHITLALSPGTKPAVSNELLARRAANENIRTGLGSWFDELGLKQYQAPALEWCVSTGAASTEEIAKNAEDVAAAVESKDVEQRERVQAIFARSAPGELHVVPTDTPLCLRGRVVGRSRGGKILRRSKSSLIKVGGIPLLPCEETLQPLVEEYVKFQEVGDTAGMDDVQFRLLKRHPFVNSQTKPVKSEALAEGVSCEAFNFRISVPSFQRWLRKPEGQPFAERGKGYDDAAYLTSALMRMLMPRGYTTFVFKNASGEEKSVVLRGFMKFSGPTAADEDEESGATSEVDAFMFRGYTRADAQRFVVTHKSNGENGKYTVRNVFGKWYCFAGSKNTGRVWLLDKDATTLYPIPKDPIAAVGPKIISQVYGMLNDMPPDSRQELLETVNKEASTIIIEQNDPQNEHILPIDVLSADHVAVLRNTGYPLPQREAVAFFDKFKLRHEPFDVYDDMTQLETVMNRVRASTDTEGAVIYLERQDDAPVGLLKVKSDHYVIARRTRETLRGALVSSVGKGTSLDDALSTVRERLRKGMRNLNHVAGCKEHHREWSDLAMGFAESWAAAYKAGDVTTKQALVNEFNGKYGSMYENFWSAWQKGQKNVQPVLLLDK